MLTELTITNFAIIDRLQLQLGPGFNVLTGETGAGKSIIIDAVTLLLGSRADPTFVRAGADVAQVEGAFQLDEELRAQLSPILEREGLEGDEPDALILAREIRAGGRAYCRVNGRTVSLGILEEIGQPLIDIHGQSEHLSLLRVPTHQRFLDRYAGLDAQREALSEEVRSLRAARKELEALLRDEHERARRVDQLTYQLGEIDAARLKPGEEESLLAERTRLANAEKLTQLADEVCVALYDGSDEQLSATDLLTRAERALVQLAKIDPELQAQQQLAETLAIQVGELAHALRAYREGAEANPARLTDVEERLGLIHALKRKYGGTIGEILEFARQAGADLERLAHGEERMEELRAELERLRQVAGGQAEVLSQARREAGERLASEVEAQLADLSMPGARFAVELTQSDDPAGVYVDGRTLACTETGVDRVEFLIAPNPGEGFKPLVKVASGGETSRLMLALKTVLAAADETPTLIFDEIDQGIGGRVGSVVGRKLRQVTRTAGRQRQVLCVTHLPQIAGYADTHFLVEKKVHDERTATRVRVVAGPDRVEELATMLGTPSEGTRRSAREILEEATQATSQPAVASQPEAGSPQPAPASGPGRRRGRRGSQEAM